MDHRNNPDKKGPNPKGNKSKANQAQGQGRNSGGAPEEQGVDNISSKDKDRKSGDSTGPRNSGGGQEARYSKSKSQANPKSKPVLDKIQSHYSHVATFTPSVIAPHPAKIVSKIMEREQEQAESKRKSEEEERRRRSEEESRRRSEEEKRRRTEDERRRSEQERRRSEEERRRSEEERRRSEQERRRSEQERRRSEEASHRQSRQQQTFPEDNKDRKKFIGENKLPPQPSYSEIFAKLSTRVMDLQRRSGLQPSERDEYPEMTWMSLDEETKKRMEDTAEDIKITENLAEKVDEYENERMDGQYIPRKEKKIYPKYTYSEIVDVLEKQGIPVPTDEDFARLEATHGTRWDPDGTVVEYYSPVLRSFIPINMRGRYRGCWAEDRCIQGLDISKLDPKPDILEGFVDRGRKINIEAKYKAMYDVAQDEAHLDYLIEMQKFQSEILPIPIMYEVLHFGTEILHESLNIIIDEEQLPPSNRIYQTTEKLALNTRKRIQMYAALGIESLNDARSGIGKVDPQWEKTRDELITNILSRQHRESNEFSRRRVFNIPSNVDPKKAIVEILKKEAEEGIVPPNAYPDFNEVKERLSKAIINMEEAEAKAKAPKKPRVRGTAVDDTPHAGEKALRLSQIKFKDDDDDAT